MYVRYSGKACIDNKVIQYTFAKVTMTKCTLQCQQAPAPGDDGDPIYSNLLRSPDTGRILSTATNNLLV